MNSGGRPDEQPNAGAPTSDDDPGLNIELLRRRREKVLAIVAAAFVMLGAVITAVYLLRPPAVNVSELIEAAHAAVRQSTCRGVICEFSEASETTVETLSSGDHMVSADVAAITRAGDLTRSFHFRCVLRRDPNGAAWLPAKLEVIPY